MQITPINYNYSNPKAQKNNSKPAFGLLTIKNLDGFAADVFGKPALSENLGKEAFDIMLNGFVEHWNLATKGRSLKGELKPTANGYRLIVKEKRRNIAPSQIIEISDLKSQHEAEAEYGFQVAGRVGDALKKIIEPK